MMADIVRELAQSASAASLAIALVLAWRRPLRLRLGAQAAYATWLLVPLAVLAVLLPASGQGAVAWNGIALVVERAAGVATAGAPAGFDVDLALLCLWLAGAGLAATVFVARQRRFERLIERQTSLDFDLVDGHGPALVGWWRGRVVLPRDFRQRYDADEQRMVLAHERAHQSRGDLRAQTLATALRCLFWFNPLLHYAAARFRIDQELACDATVLARFPNQRRHYGAAMLKTQLADFGLPLGCHWQSSHPLKERIAMLKQALPTVAGRRVSAALVASLLALGSYAAWAAQPASAPAPAAAGGAAPWLTSLGGDDEVFAPAYPAAALAAGIPGKVVLEVLVGTDRAIKDVRVISAEPAGVFEQATVAAARKWRLHPAMRNGQPVQQWVRVPIEFKPDPKPPVKPAS